MILWWEQILLPAFSWSAAGDPLSELCISLPTVGLRGNILNSCLWSASVSCPPAAEGGTSFGWNQHINPETK